jgi:predicted PurR-regulated permease PerM
VQGPPSSRQAPPWSQITLFLLTVAVLVLCALILQPLFAAIVGAIVLAVATQPPYDWLATKIRNRNLCATVALLIVIIAIILPCILLTQEIVDQAINTVNAFRHDANHERFFAFLARHPDLTARVQSITDSIDVDETIKSSAAFIGRHLFQILGSSVVVITELVFLLFILFFLFRDRDQALTFARSLLPLRDDEATELLTRVDDTIKATALGRLAIAAVQGILAGLGYWVLGVPGVILWAFTTAVFALIPAVGTIFIWGPIALYLGFNGHWGKAAILAVWGGVVVSTIDNVLYPIFVGSRIQAHTATILISIIGGVAIFGITGIVIGPVAFTLADALLDIWHARSAQPQ